ncbi:MAG: hypothetical protein IJR87_06460 [Bacteroidaceae bacterium]|nr:hypothetical protein [Bacteroidaceae bacterium]
MILFSLLLWGSGIWALEPDADGVYQIGMAEDLMAFSDLVNGGEYGANAVLTADIDLSGISYFPPIGKQYYPKDKGPQLYFSGTFDGQGHIIYNLSIDKDDPGAETGLFGRLNGATVQNLGIVNATFKNASALRAGVLGACSVGSKIINCFTAGDIAMEECICNFENRNGSGLIGLITSGTAVSNCYTTYGALGYEAGGNTIKNCYWGEDVANMAPTGELCYKLNGDQQNIVWYQTLGEDASPIFDSTHKQVYAIGDIKCDGTVLSEEASYTNDKDAASPIPPHNYVDGACTECGQPDPALVPIVDGWYEVSTPAQLLSISELVNGGKYDINVRLTDDIDLDGISYFPPIGKQYYPQGPTLYFSGIFDGQGHIIYNLSIDLDDAGAETGLFGRLNGATVQNLGIVNATLRNSSALRAGVLGACAVGSTIINCFTAGDIMMEECICSFENRNGSGLIGLITSGTVVSNCYTTHGALGYEAGVTTINNCYWGEEVTDMAPTGELCYKLNGNTFINPNWYQTIGEDNYPVPDNTHGIVYTIDGMTYACFQGEASFKEFQNSVLDAESNLIEEAVATQSILDACEAALEALSGIDSKDEFLTAYNEYKTLKKELLESIDAYAAYKQKAEEVNAFLEENEGLQGKLRNLLASYLRDEVEPNDDFEFGSYIYIMENHTLTTTEIQAETIKIQTMLDNALAADYGPGTDITKLLKNGDFKDGWNGWENGLGNGTYYYESIDVVGCESWNSDGKIEQTIEDLKDGAYLVSMAAAYRPSNDPMSYAYNAYIYLNDNCVYIPTVYETYVPVEEAVDGVNCNLTIPSTDAELPVTDEDGNLIGYAIHGTPGIAIAASAGRSMCYMVAHVSDGKLTIGVNNPGSKYGSDWTGWADIHLTYLGSMAQADEQLSTVLEGQIARANTLLDKYVFNSDNFYAKLPNYSQALRDQLLSEIAEAETATTPNDKYAVIENFSETFKEIYTSKRQYVETMNSVETIVTVADELYPNLISDEENDAVIALWELAWMDYENGTLDEDKTMAQFQTLSFVPDVVDGWYEIDTPAKLRYISELVNDGKYDIKVSLTADIDLTGISYFPPIGKQYYPQGPELYFSGTFDGQGHVIYNLSIDKDDAGAETGLFGRLNGATVQNVGVVNATLKNSSALRAGVLGGCAVGSTIKNCFTTGDIVTDECICRFENKNGSGLIGLITSGSEVSNCYTTYIKLGYEAGVATINNCYWSDDANAWAPTGELCYKLNGDQSEIVWYQAIGTDAYPVLDASHGKVVKDEDGVYRTVTSIETVRANMSGSGVIYNLTGQRVEKAVKGIYIINGKKTLVE